jgi:hypothetical protein
MELNNVRLEASSRVQGYASGEKENPRRRPPTVRVKSAPAVPANEADLVEAEESDRHQLDDVV